EEIRHRAGRRPIANPWMPHREHAEQLASAPEGMRLTGADEQFRHGVRDLVRAPVRGPAPIREATAALRVVPSQPFVADTAADTEPRTELAHGKPITQRI